MKYLQDYMEQKQSKAFAKAGAFFAVSQSQFDEAKAKLPDVKKFVHIGAHLYCDKKNAKWLVDKLGEIYAESMRQDIQDHGLERIILRELGNYECWYTGDIEPCWEAIQNYPGIKKEYVARLFTNKNYKIKNDEL